MERIFKNEIITHFKGLRVTYDDGMVLTCFKGNWIVECLLCHRYRGVGRLSRKLKKNMEALIWSYGNWNFECNCGPPSAMRCSECRKPYPKEVYRRTIRGEKLGETIKANSFNYAWFCGDSCHKRWIKKLPEDIQPILTMKLNNYI